MKRKWLAIGIILIFVGASMTPSIGGHISENENIVRQINDSNSVNDTIIDWIEDVYSVNQSTTHIANSSDIQVQNIDIQQITFAKKGLQVNLTLQVLGVIENKGGILNGHFVGMEVVDYYCQLTTSEEDYLIEYCNQTCILTYDNESINLTSSDFTVVNDTLSIGFSLISPDETYENLYAGSVYMKSNSELIFLYDIVPNILCKMVCIGIIHDMIITRDYFRFNPIFMPSILLNPFNVYPLTKGSIIVSRQYLGYVGRGFIIGVFNVDLSIFWPAQNPTPLITHQIRNSLFSILHRRGL